MFKTTHNLQFEIADNPNPFLGAHKLFRVGTCKGQWGCTSDSYYILTVINSVKGNGHLDDVFEWFENSAKRDNKNLLVLEIINKDFYTHLLQKRGFIPLDEGGNNCIKVFYRKQYNKLLRDGNEIIKKGTLTCV